MPAQAEALAPRGTKHIAPLLFPLNTYFRLGEAACWVCSAFDARVNNYEAVLWNPARPLLPAASSKVRDVFGTSSFPCFRWEILTQQAGTSQSKLCFWVAGVLVRVSEG